MKIGLHSRIEATERSLEDDGVDTRGFPPSA
jgi:hypothetical protein